VRDLVQKVLQPLPQFFHPTPFPLRVAGNTFYNTFYLDDAGGRAACARSARFRARAA
jgi:hypothetical protein